VQLTPQRPTTSRRMKTTNLIERPTMKISKYCAALALTLLPLLAGFAQSTPTAPASQKNEAPLLSWGAAEVEKLVRSGVGDDVVLSFIAQSQVYFSLSAADIVALKSAGVSSQAVAAMLDHDSALHNQQLASTPGASAAYPTPVTTVPSAPATETSNPASTTTVVVPPSPAPAPPVEVIPVSPGPDYLWTPGWWSWNGGAWIWFSGYWGHPMRPGHVWFKGNFYHGRGAEPFHGGHRR